MDRMIITMCRYICREAVKVEIRRKGLKVAQFSLRDLTELADEYLETHLDEVFAEVRERQVRLELQVRAHLASRAQAKRLRNSREIPVQISGAK